MRLSFPVVLIGAVALLAPPLFANTANLAAAVSEACNTTTAIQYVSEIPNARSLSQEQQRRAVLRAIGDPESQANFFRENFVGQWFYEHEAENVVFAGYNIRSHYLGTAIVIESGAVYTLICRSSNMNQSSRSIHRKAPLWKEDLDSKIRIEMGREAAAQLSEPIAGEQTKNGADALKSTESIRHLLRAGVISREEHDELLERVK